MSVVGTARVAQAAAVKAKMAGTGFGILNDTILGTAKAAKTVAGLPIGAARGAGKAYRSVVRGAEKAMPAAAAIDIGARVRRMDKTAMLVAGSLSVGAVTGLASSMRDTARTLNRSAGNPAGFASSLGVRTAFMGNPENSRSRQGGASGRIPLNSRR